MAFRCSRPRVVFFVPGILRRALHELPQGHGGILAGGELEFHDETLLMSSQDELKAEPSMLMYVNWYALRVRMCKDL